MCWPGDNAGGAVCVTSLPPNNFWWFHPTLFLIVCFPWARIILDSAMPLVMQKGGIPQRYASILHYFASFAGHHCIPPLLFAQCALHCPTTSRLSFFHQVLGNIKTFLDMNRNEVCLCVSVQCDFMAIALCPFETMMIHIPNQLIPPSCAAHRS